MEKKACTFFGHRDCPETIKPKIRTAVIDLIENHGVTMFYVGNQGNFDRMVRSILKEVTTAYPEVGYAVVLAYMPSAKKRTDDFYSEIARMELKKFQNASPSSGATNG